MKLERAEGISDAMKLWMSGGISDGISIAILVGRKLGISLGTLDGTNLDEIEYLTNTASNSVTARPLEIPHGYRIERDL